MNDENNQGTGGAVEEVFLPQGDAVTAVSVGDLGGAAHSQATVIEDEELPAGVGLSTLPPSLAEVADTRSVRARRWSPLESITVNSFKAVKQATIPLDSVTILVGPNGCGKSSVLQAIHWAARAASYVLPKNTKEMISFERLDYVPSSEPLTTLHNGELKSDSASKSVEVVFAHRPSGEESRAAPEYNTQVVLTTHSPHIVRAASSAAKLVWMKNGVVETEDDEVIRRLLGWGGLDKSALFFVEDEDDKPLRAVLRQWPELLRQIAVCRCFGIDNLPRDKFLTGLLIDGKLKSRALLHRDGDFMTPEEAELWIKGFETRGVFPWVTTGSDIEAYFCQADYLATLYGVSIELAETWRQDAAKKVGKARETFLEKRKNVVRVVWPNGGSPNAEAMWEAAGGPSASTVKGKRLLASLKTVVKAAKHDDSLLNSLAIPDGYTVAPELKALIETAIASDSAKE